MVDLEALREALANAESMVWGYEGLDAQVEQEFGPGDPAESETWHRRFAVLADAARSYLRLMEGAVSVWWCEVHKHTGEEAGCLLRWHPMFDDAEDGRCRMVKADLHIRAEVVPESLA